MVIKKERFLKLTLMCMMWVIFGNSHLPLLLSTNIGTNRHRYFYSLNISWTNNPVCRNIYILVNVVMSAKKSGLNYILYIFNLWYCRDWSWWNQIYCWIPEMQRKKKGKNVLLVWKNGKLKLNSLWPKYGLCLHQVLSPKFLIWTDQPSPASSPPLNSSSPRHCVGFHAGWSGGGRCLDAGTHTGPGWRPIHHAGVAPVPVTARGRHTWHSSPGHTAA